MEHAQACKESTTVSVSIFMKFISVQNGHVQISSTSFIQIGKKNVDSMDRNSIIPLSEVWVSLC